MSDFDWQSFLKQWSEEFIEAGNHKSHTLSDEIKQSRWLGFPPATEEQLAEAEKRLGVTLPPSYRAFLKVTNGWHYPSDFVERLLPVEELEWDTEWKQMQLEAEKTVQKFYGASEPPFDLDAYLDYEQGDTYVPEGFIKAALQISIYTDGTYVLNPKIVNADGEWEAWFFAPWVPGADRYPSFQAMMQREYTQFLNLDYIPLESTSAEMVNLAIRLGLSLEEAEAIPHLPLLAKLLIGLRIGQVEANRDQKVADQTAAVIYEHTYRKVVAIGDDTRPNTIAKLKPILQKAEATTRKLRANPLQHMIKDLFTTGDNSRYSAEFAAYQEVIRLVSSQLERLE